ncbi:aminotransferase class V-fold PLP-dependent enzyme [Corynebacterium suedekumii]|nr:aminotransferase class V-fold PLP-dependent enzyme [Corynebacterium suedekumii]
MIEVVTMEGTTFAAAPQRFEAGTQMTSQVVGLGAAVDFLTEIGSMDTIHAHEQDLDRLRPRTAADGPRPADRRSHHRRDARRAAVAFDVEGIHPHDLGQVLDSQGVCIRVGHHCAWPAHRALSAQSTARASFYLYNTREEIDALVDAILNARDFFGVS